MVERYYVVEGLFILLAVAFIITIIKHPKDTLITLPLAIITFPFRRIGRQIHFLVALISFPVIYFGKKYKWKFVKSLSKFLGSADDEHVY